MISGFACRPWRALLTAALAATLLLAGCSDSGDDGGTGGESPSGEAGSGVSPYLPVPDGVELTTQGTELALGEDATVAYEPSQGDEVGALDITVTRLDKASFKDFSGWKLSKETKSTQPYFVTAKIRNVGSSNLGDRRPPLYAVDGENKLIESSTFASTFQPCPSANFPKKFKTGDTVSSCLVFLVPDHGDLEAVSFRPTEDFNPITWVGELTTPEPPKADSGKNDKGDDKGKGDKNKNDKNKGDQNKNQG